MTGLWITAQQVQHQVAKGSLLAPAAKGCEMIGDTLEGPEHLHSSISNTLLEAINFKMQWIKRQTGDYRNSRE